jgi:hypothetical protein
MQAAISPTFLALQGKMLGPAIKSLHLENYQRGPGAAACK